MYICTYIGHDVLTHNIVVCTLKHTTVTQTNLYGIHTCTHKWVQLQTPYALYGVHVCTH